MTRKLLVAVAADQQVTQASPMLRLAASLAASGDSVHVVSVLPPPSAGLPPLTSAAAAAAVMHASDASHDIETARRAVSAARDGLASLGCPRAVPHILPSAGGASGAAASLAAWAHSRHVDVVVVGCRGLGATGRALAPLVGLGSVSDALVKDAHAPAVAVARGGAGDSAPPLDTPPVVVVGVDGSGPSMAAVRWAARTLARRGDTGARLHVVAAAMLPPLPIHMDDASAVTAIESHAWEASKEAALEEARVASTDAAAAAASLLPAEGAVAAHALLPAGGAQGAADELVAYAHRVGATLIVVGSRGLSAWRRALLSIVGMGSVSTAVAHRAPCGVVVVRAGGEDEDHAHPAKID